MEEVLHNINYSFDLIALTETWQTDENLFTPGILPGYQKYEGISGTTKNSGCGFYIKETIPYVLRDNLSKKHKSQESEFEALWLEIVGSANENIVVGVIYRHPRPKQTQFLKYLKNKLNKKEKENKKTIFIGDFHFLLKISFIIIKWTKGFFSLMR